IHLCTIRDFVTLCDALDITVERCFSVRRSGKAREVRPSSALANLIGEQAVVLLGRE
ncbi:MAG: methionine biosynthesis protein MetW, partial [Proteobacteria bacterium]|nr:methionine biosynthesis protein MetW [Pseudomonadota bacterium]